MVKHTQRICRPLWTYFTPCSGVSIVNFEQVNFGWAAKHLWLSFFICFCKRCVKNDTLLIILLDMSRCSKALQCQRETRTSGSLVFCFSEYPGRLASVKANSCHWKSTVNQMKMKIEEKLLINIPRKVLLSLCTTNKNTKMCYLKQPRFKGLAYKIVSTFTFIRLDSCPKSWKR